MRKRLIGLLIILAIICVSIYLEFLPNPDTHKRNNEFSVNREKTEFVVN